MAISCVLRRLSLLCAVVALFGWNSLVLAASAATPVHVVKADLKTLIREAVDSPVQFAVLVPHTASTVNSGKWSTANGRATWRYAVEIPTAVSMSFHAAQSSLPESAVLVVRGAKSTTSYRARDLHRGELWSRIHPGEALQFTLTVAAAERSKVSLKIVSLQAGYRSLGAGVQDHPYYRQLKAQLDQATGNAACVTNYECEATTANTPAGQATVALVIGNLYQCSGSLINDVPEDNTPYVLTARHCESGKLGGGNPGAASSVTVYWDASTPCGDTLPSIYNGGTPLQTGAQTVVEQQDAWLIKLDASPVVTDAQFAGFDASGGAVQGGYTIHLAEGYGKQFAEWYGQAYAAQLNDVDGTSYLSNFLETVNQLGNVGPGASGSGLFDQNNHLVGSLTGGPASSDPSGYGACPVAPLTAPNGSNTVAYFTALASVWNSTADTTSTTGSTTLKSVLDPGNTGTEVVQSLPEEVLTFVASAETATFNESVGLTWNAPGASQCVPGGGVAGDGWTGVLASTGTKGVQESSAGSVTYTLACSYPGGRSANASQTVDWVGPQPVLTFTSSTAVAWTNSPVILYWSSNVTPCAISGGNVSLNNLAASGNTTVTQSAVGDVLYTLTCGPTNNSASFSQLEQWEAPNLMLRANGTDRLLGQSFELEWDAVPNAACAASGGAPNDGWSSAAFPPGGFGEFSPQVTTLGTYTYTLQCSAGTVSQQQSVTVTFENNAPYVTASLSTTSVTFSNSPSDYVTLTYNSNLSSCSLTTDPNIPLTNSGSLQVPPDPQGLVALAPAQSGSYQITLRCEGGPNYDITSTPLTLTVAPPPAPTAQISFTPSAVVEGETFSAAWSSTYTSDCNLSGGIPGGGSWNSSGQELSPSGSYNESGATGSYSFGVTCASIDPSTSGISTSATLTIGPLTASLAASPISVTEGSSFTLTWSSVGATACSGNGGGANGSLWQGALAASGSATQSATVPGTYTYTLICSAGDASTAPKAATITVKASTSTSGSGSSGGGGGGGGGTGLLELGALAALLALRRPQRLRARDPERFASAA